MSARRQLYAVRSVHRCELPRPCVVVVVDVASMFKHKPDSCMPTGKTPYPSCLALDRFGHSIGGPIHPLPYGRTGTFDLGNGTLVAIVVCFRSL